jgi:NADH-quinone oxidoreductase subunit C
MTVDDNRTDNHDGASIKSGPTGVGSPSQASPLMQTVLAVLGEMASEHYREHGDDRIHVAREKIVEVAQRLRDAPELAFDMITDITAVDYLGQPDGFALQPEIWDRKESVARRVRQSRHRLVLPPRGPLMRFAVVYHLFSTTRLHRLRIKCRVPEDDPTISTLTGVWKGADWLERETYDLCGIRFVGHPDLRRIYLYEEFVGHPLRKDYDKRDEQPIQKLLGPAGQYPRRPE